MPTRAAGLRRRHRLRHTRTGGITAMAAHGTEPSRSARGEPGRPPRGVACAGHVFAAHVRGDPGLVWAALTDPGRTAAYLYGLAAHSTWVPGDPIEFRLRGRAAVDRPRPARTVPPTAVVPDASRAGRPAGVPDLAAAAGPGRVHGPPGNRRGRPCRLTTRRGRRLAARPGCATTPRPSGLTAVAYARPAHHPIMQTTSKKASY